MKLLADEHIERELVDWLRATGHDVLWVAQSMPSAPDPDLIDVAVREDRVILTKDLDFGELIFRAGSRVRGLILLRLATRNPAQRLELIRTMWPEIESRCLGHLVVLSPHRIRARPMPSP